MCFWIIFPKESLLFVHQTTTEQSFHNAMLSVGFAVLSWICVACPLTPCDVICWQHQDREGEEGACEAAWDDQDGD